MDGIGVCCSLFIAMPVRISWASRPSPPAKSLVDSMDGAVLGDAVRNPAAPYAETIQEMRCPNRPKMNVKQRNPRFLDHNIRKRIIA